MDAIPSSIESLFLEVGLQAEEIAYVTFDEEGRAWSVQFDDETLLLAEWDGIPPRLVLQARLGTPAEYHKARVNEVVLTYGALWSKTGGGRIGRASDDGELVLLLDVPADGLAPGQLAHTLRQLKSAAAAWSQFVSAPGDDKPAALLEPMGLIACEETATHDPHVAYSLDAGTEHGGSRVGTMPSRIQAVFRAISSRPFIGQMLFDEEANAWRGQFPGGMPVFIKWDDTPPRLVFQAHLGAPPERDKARVHEAVLTYNALWDKTGSARIVRLEHYGDLLLVLESTCEGIEAERFLYMVRQISDAAAAWSRFVVTPGDDDPPALGDPLALTMWA